MPIIMTNDDDENEPTVHERSAHVRLFIDEIPRKIIGICRNPHEPFYWDADRVGEPCPGCSNTPYEESWPHEYYVEVEIVDEQS